MTLKIMLWATYVLDVMFFTGLVGCVAVVTISWVSIVRDSLSDSDEE
jgi:hypothetical protein